MTDVFSLSIPHLREWSKRQPVDHRLQNEPVDVLNRMATGIARPRMKASVAGGTAAEASAMAGRVLLAMDAGLTDDHLVGRAVDSDPADYVPILVAKPWLLRKTPWDGETREQVRYVYDLEDSTKRTAYDINDPPGTEEQDRNKRTEMISPQYIPDDELTVVPADTGVALTHIKPDPDNPEGPPIAVVTPVTLIDISGSRGWMVVFEQL